MSTINCKECGLFYQENNMGFCYATKKQLEQLELERCSDFITIQFDGDLPFSPEQHMFLFNDVRDKQKMKTMQGLRFL